MCTLRSLFRIRLGPSSSNRLKSTYSFYFYPLRRRSSLLIFISAHYRMAASCGMPVFFYRCELFNLLFKPLRSYIKLRLRDHLPRGCDSTSICGSKTSLALTPPALSSSRQHFSCRFLTDAPPCRSIRPLCLVPTMWLEALNRLHEPAECYHHTPPRVQAREERSA